MVRRWRMPLFVVPVALLGLLALLATLQYRWLGQVGEAERTRMRAFLTAGASGLVQELDSEVTRAYLLFQTDPLGDADDLATRFAGRYERWQATSHYPRLVGGLYAFTPGPGASLERFDPATRAFTPVPWPESMRDWRMHLTDSASETTAGRNGRDTVTIRHLPAPVWASVPAIVVPAPMLLEHDRRPGDADRGMAQLSYSILTIDEDYVARQMLPALAEQHILRAGGMDFQVAIVSRAGRVLYHSNGTFNPAPDSPADVTADLLNVRTQDFGRVSAEVRSLTLLTAALRIRRAGEDDRAVEHSGPASGRRTVVIERNTGPATTPPVSSERIGAPASTWQLLLKHQAGSLEVAVAGVRRRNLLVSFTILGVLGASAGLLVLSTRRAQRLAQQQMEFVATVSHELRTPLAVIRSAGENLADGVIADEAHVRKYGELVRGEGRRLTEMVEQILEFSGIESGARRLTAGPVPVGPLLREVVDASSPMIRGAQMDVALHVPDGLPPVLGDEPSLRRVFQNLVTNAVKYGADGRWIGIDARRHGASVEISVTDRGIGIDTAAQAHIFEPFYRAPAVIAAQVSGAGLGLSLVERIVRAHGGRVTVRTAPGAGSAFVVHLPVAPGGHTPAVSGDGAPREHPGAANRRVESRAAASP